MKLKDILFTSLKTTLNLNSPTSRIYNLERKLSKLMQDANIRTSNSSSAVEKVINNLESELSISKTEALRLRVGGSCVHGGDKGPYCSICFSVSDNLTGPYCDEPAGFDIAVFCLQHLRSEIKEKQLMSIEQQIDDFSLRLSQVDSLIKNCESTLSELRLLHSIRNRSSLEEEEEEELSEVEFIQEKENQKLTQRIKKKKFCVVFDDFSFYFHNDQNVCDEHKYFYIALKEETTFSKLRSYLKVYAFKTLHRKYLFGSFSLCGENIENTAKVVDVVADHDKTKILRFTIKSSTFETPNLARSYEKICENYFHLVEKKENAIYPHAQVIRALDSGKDELKLELSNQALVLSEVEVIAEALKGYRRNSFMRLDLSGNFLASYRLLEILQPLIIMFRFRSLCLGFNLPSKEKILTKNTSAIVKKFIKTLINKQRSHLVTLDLCFLELSTDETTLDYSNSELKKLEKTCETSFESMFNDSESFLMMSYSMSVLKINIFLMLTLSLVLPRPLKGLNFLGKVKRKM
eukprot:snap_masked-scaffold_13-processed-gene-7.20-mRNA-1 protein AED:1.00 eAED:1.00 QI:0/0/0/0/1/1/2/0/519